MHMHNDFLHRSFPYFSRYCMRNYSFSINIHFNELSIICEKNNTRQREISFQHFLPLRLTITNPSRDRFIEFKYITSKQILSKIFFESSKFFQNLMELLIPFTDSSSIKAPLVTLLLFKYKQ